MNSEPAARMPFLVLNALLLTGIAALLLIKFNLLSRLNINWDEFLFASKIYMFDRGELTRPLQTFHVHLFGWLKTVPGNGIDQIIAARETMFALRVIGCLCVFAIGRTLYGTTGALVAVLASMGFSYMMMHGESFRADPLISFCFIVAATLLIVWRERLWATLAAAVLMAVASMISIKTIFYGPTIAALLLITLIFSDQRSRAVRHALVFSITAAGVLALLFAWHSATLAADIAPALGTKLADTGEGMFSPPFPSMFQTTYRWDNAWWLLLMAGVVAALINCVRGDAEAKRTALNVLALTLPLTSVAFYRNSFPYYYICLVPAAAIALGYLAAIVTSLIPRRPALAATAIGIAMLIASMPTIRLIKHNSANAITPQRQLLEAVHAMFPEPVPYIDRCSMVVDYPKHGIFMSTLVAGIYREQATPVMQALVTRHQPVFLIENSAGLYLDRSADQLAASPYRLLPEDHEYLQQHYLPHWGPIRVAGQSLQLHAGQPKHITLPVAGPYTVEAEAPIHINDVAHAPGSVIQIRPGNYELRTEQPTTHVVLRYGGHLHRPTAPPPLRHHLFTGLGFRTELF